VRDTGQTKCSACHERQCLDFGFSRRGPDHRRGRPSFPGHHYIREIPTLLEQRLRQHQRFFSKS
jgi:hypothetical protein